MAARDQGAEEDVNSWKWHKKSEKLGASRSGVT
jgi:hypothetical protein